MSSRNVNQMLVIPHQAAIPNGPAGYYSFTRVSDGGNSPRDSRGRLILRDNNYDCLITSIYNPTIVYQNKREGKCTGAKYSAAMSDVGLSCTFSALPSSEDSLTLVNRLFEKFQQSDFNLAVSIAEGRESVQMIIGRLKSLGFAALELKRLNLGGALRHLGPVSREAKKRAQRALDLHAPGSAWMELRYGWIPTLMDIYFAAQFIKTDYQDLHRSIVVSHKREAEAVSTSAPNAVTLGKAVRIDRWKATLKVSSAPSLPERLGLTNPSLVFWELVPLSFVWDWFLPIGKFLNALHALKVLPVSTITKTTFIKRSCASTPTSSRCYYVTGVYRHRDVQVTRRVGQGLPSGWDLVKQTPRSYKINLSRDLKRMADLSVITSQRIASLLRR